MAKNPIFAVLWIALLFFIAWPVAGFCCAFWIFIQVSSFNPCLVHRELSLESEASHIKSNSALFESFGAVFTTCGFISPNETPWRYDSPYTLRNSPSVAFDLYLSPRHLLNCTQMLIQTAIRSLLWLRQENILLLGKNCHLAQRGRQGDQRLQLLLSRSLLEINYPLFLNNMEYGKVLSQLCLLSEK